MTTMELFMVRSGSSQMAVAAAQVARVEPCPSDLSWPPGADGVMTWAPGNGEAPAMRVVDPTTRWPASEETPLSNLPRKKPTALLVLAGGGLALAVDSYALTTAPVHAGPPVLQARGIHALTRSGDGWAIVLDMARLVL